MKTTSTRKSSKANRSAKASAKAPKAPEKATEAPEKATEKKAPGKQPLVVLRKNGTASVETMVSEAVGAHFVCETEQAPKQGYGLVLETKAGKKVLLIARYVKELKRGGTLVMAFLPRLSPKMKKDGKVSAAPILAAAKGEECRISWDVKQPKEFME